MWKSNVKNILTFACRSEIKQRGYFEEFPDCAITYHTCPHHSRRPERQTIIDRMHTWQQCSVTLSEDILTTKYGFNLREISSLSIDNNTNISDAHAWIGPRNHQVGTLLKRHTLVPSPPPPLHSVAWCKRGLPTSPPGGHSLAESRHVVLDVICLMFTALPTVSQFWKTNTVKANARCFTVVSAITECWHTKFQHVRYVWFGESLQKHSKIHCPSPSRGLWSQQWSH